jgi:hypothetical protein
MYIFLKNKGTTCFFNSAFQILIQNPFFVSTINNSQIPSGSDEEIQKYLTYINTNPMNPNVPTELHIGRHYGFICVLKKFTQAYQQPSTNIHDCVLANVDELSHYLFLVRHAIRTNTQHDVLECVDEILDVLSIPGTQRPSPLVIEKQELRQQTIESIRNAVNNHCGSLSSLWGVTERVDTCLTCKNVLRYEYNPFLWISKVKETRQAEATCEYCKQTTTRQIQTNILIPPESIIVQLSRHNDNGTKNHSNLPLSTTVNINGARFSLRVIVYHDGWSFNSGHYTCAIRTQDNRWMTNSDASACLMPGSFDISEHQTNKTYAALYLKNN